MTPVITISLVSVATGFVGMAACLIIIWRASNNLAKAKTAVRAEQALLLFGILAGAGLALIAYPLVSDYAKPIKGFLSFIGVAGLGALFKNYKKWHLGKDFTRRSLTGMGRELFVYFVVVALAAAVLLPFAHLLIGNTDIGD